MICKICGNPALKHSHRCEEHWRCDVCGITKNLHYRNGGVFCDNCHAKAVEKQVEEFDGNTSYEREITCPWCGYEKTDSWEADDENTHGCDNCGNEYTHTRNIEITYSTEKTEQCESDNEKKT